MRATQAAGDPVIERQAANADSVPSSRGRTAARHRGMCSPLNMDTPLPVSGALSKPVAARYTKPDSGWNRSWCQRSQQENRIFCTKKQGVFRTKDPSCKTVRAKPAFVESHVQVRANSAGCMATGRRTAVTPINKQHFLPASLRPPPVIVDGSTPRFIRSQRNAAPEPYTKVGPRI